jgi:hypothetical protein
MEKEHFGFTLTEVFVKKYKVTGDNCPNDMEITISMEGNAYVATCNYSLKTKIASNAYQAMHFKSTAEETLSHLLMSFKAGLKSENECIWEKNI